MVYVIGVVIAIFLVGGQALWKTGVDHHGLRSVVDLITSPYVVAGGVLYGLAAIGYFYALSKFDYSIVQSLVVGSSLILTFLVAKLFFAEKISLMNLIGLVILIIGMLLVGRR